MSPADAILILAVGLANLTAFGVLLHRRWEPRYPLLLAHLLVEGGAQCADGLLAPTPWGDAAWCWMQIPRLALRCAVAVEVSLACTSTLGTRERRGLWATCGLACGLVGLVAVQVTLLAPVPTAVETSAQSALLLGRQYVLLALLTWLVTVNAYLLYSRVRVGGHNLDVYRAFSALSATVAFIASAFVWGGLGYRSLPFGAESWVQVHRWACWYTILVIGVLALFSRRESP